MLWIRCDALKIKVRLASMRITAGGEDGAVRFLEPRFFGRDAHLEPVDAREMSISAARCLHHVPKLLVAEEGGERRKRCVSPALLHVAWICAPSASATAGSSFIWRAQCFATAQTMAMH